MYCRNCGKELPESSIYCPKCGTKIGPSSDPIISGMESFGVNDNSSNKTENSTDWGEFIRGILILLGIVIYNAIFGIITYFTTSYLVKAYVGVYYLQNDEYHKYDGWYYFIYLTPIMLWQYINDKTTHWSYDFQFNKLEDVDIFTWILIFIPIVPTIISYYFLTQNENLLISMQNVGIYVISLISCWIYYWIKKHPSSVTI